MVEVKETNFKIALVLFKNTINFGSVYPNRWDRRNYETKFLTHGSFLCLSIKLPLPYFLISYFPNQFNFFFNAQTILLANVAILSRYQSPVKCRSRKLEGNFTHKVNYRYYCHLPGLEFI
jgi:hypothetical protein